MLSLGLGFLAGCLLLHSGTALLPFVDLAGVAVLLVLSLYLRLHRLLLGTLAGVLWAGVLAVWLQPATIADQGKKVRSAELVVRGLPDVYEDRVRFVADVQRLDGQPGDWRLRVTWRTTGQSVRAGQKWRLPLRIRPANSYHNPGGWDYAGWLYRRGVRHTAYVTRGDPQLLSADACCSLGTSRQGVRDRIQQSIDAGAGRAMLLALVLGDRSELDKDAKEALAVTGTAHLVAISGLHIGLIAGLMAWGVGSVWRRIPVLCRSTPALVAGTLAGLLAAAAYALLSGFALPVQRALVMLAVVALALWMRRTSEPWSVYGCALLAVLLFDPMAAQSAGFWLSFVAVAAILLTLPALRGRSLPVQAIGVQVAITLGLYPVLLAFGMPSSPWAALVNLVLIPVFAVFALPAALLLALGLLLWEGFAPGLSGMAAIFAGMLAALEWLAVHLPRLDAGGWNPARWLLLCLATLWLLLPVWPGKSAAVLLWFAVLLPLQPELEEGGFEMTLLDVGQGLSVLVRTRDHALLFDTGAAYPGGFNLAEAVVLPALRYTGVAQLDTLVLSHADNDHAGGAMQLRRGIPVTQIYAGEPQHSDEVLCDGQSWRWNGVAFHFAPRVGYETGNNASCVLLVRHAAGNLLLTGDIEATAERRYLPWAEAHLPFAVMLAPHHGSSTSSSPQWVAQTGPRYVLFAAGRNNRWGFPRPEVVERWRKAGSQALGTADSGAIRFHWTAAGVLEGPLRWRKYSGRHWHRWTD